jgi:hypothetical protein
MKKRDRAICDVLEEIQALAQKLPEKHYGPDILRLADEALVYAKKMHSRLQQNKKDLLRLAGSSIV